MKKVLVLGAGMVAPPLVRYLLNTGGYMVTEATRTVEKAERIIGGDPNGKAVRLNVNDGDELRGLISEHGLVISLLPYALHTAIGRTCIELGKDMVTTSYVSKGMQALDAKAREAGILIMNECGVDPGIDHMAAMEIIDEVHDREGMVKKFVSYCGGLPAPEANTNPWGYKFSWSSRGVVLAGTNGAQYMEGGEVREISAEELFANCWEVEVPDQGVFEAYPNRDSLKYVDIYGIPEARTVLRATLRNKGWCEVWKTMSELGMLKRGKEDLSGLAYRDYMLRLTGGRRGNETKDEAKVQLQDRLDMGPDDHIIDKFEYLGLFEDEPLGDVDNRIDVLARRLEEKLYYEPGERDMLVLYHEFGVEYPKEPKTEKISYLLSHFGKPGVDTAMAETVGLPAAIAARLILEDEVKLKGVRRPIYPELYLPILRELGQMGIDMVKNVEFEH